MNLTPDDVSRRLADVEARLESALTLNGRVGAIEARLDKLKSSGLRDWVEAIAPYVSGLVILLVGFAIKDSVTLAMQREQLNLEYVTQMRDLIKDFDEAPNLSTADANAVGLAMFGKYAILPLVARLESGDVASIAAEHGLQLVGQDAEAACPSFAKIIGDQGRRYTWKTHETLVKVIGQSGCMDAKHALADYLRQIDALGEEQARTVDFARRYSEPDGFDVENAASLRKALVEALETLDSQVPS